jgi:glucan phosphoethanolaminetransferase (alkaline phosphatase superfamily)
VLTESFEVGADEATSPRAPARSRNGRIIRLFGPAFAAAALVTPNVVAVLSLHFAPGSTSEPWGPAGRGAVQYALFALGMSGVVASIALASYHWSPARRLLHLGLLSILIELFYRIAYGGAVSSGVLLSVPETSQRETRELLAGHPMLTLFLALVALLAICALLASWRTDIRFSPTRCLRIGVVSMTMMLVSLATVGHPVGASGPIVLLFAGARTIYPIDVAAAFGGVAAGVGDTLQLASARASFTFPNVRRIASAARQDAPEIYVVVLGETSRRINWSLYGYSRPTTPHLDAIRSDLIVFERVSSNATNTILSVPLALTRATPATRGAERSEKSIITLLRQAGFETFWISNQEQSDVLQNPISRIAREADHVSFPMDIRGQGDGFDSNLLGRMNAAIAGLPKDARAVFFLHMEGSHFGYKERYPAGFAAFRGGRGAPRSLPATQMRLVDEYDNSIYFTDHNVRAIIDRLVLCRCEAGLIFFSDHGERLFDDGLEEGDFGHGFPTVSRQEIDVPFFLWLSRDYQEAHPFSVRGLKANVRSVAELSNLFETVTDLTGVDYDDRAAGRSLFSVGYRPPPQLTVLNTDEKAVSLRP